MINLLSVFLGGGIGKRKPGKVCNRKRFLPAKQKNQTTERETRTPVKACVFLKNPAV